MLNLVPALKVKDTTILDLVGQDFCYAEFVFFYRLADKLGKMAEISPEEAEKVGFLSELIYLSSKIHFELKEEYEGESALRKDLQMPVLTGDLLYGRFVANITKLGKLDYLPDYMDYLKEFNAKQIDRLQDKETKKTAKYFTLLLAETTANIIASIAGKKDSDLAALRQAADAFLEEEWKLFYEEKITSLAVLEDKMKAERS